MGHYAFLLATLRFARFASNRSRSAFSLSDSSCLRFLPRYLAIKDDSAVTADGQAWRVSRVTPLAPLSEQLVE